MSPVDRATPPEAGEIRPFEFPDVDRTTLANGLDLRVARMARLPAVSVNLFVRAGESALGERQAGLAVLTGDALEGGSDRRSGSELAEALERIGARLGASTGWEGTSVSLSCLADRLEEGLALLAEAVLEPAFPPDEVGRARDQQLAGIRQRRMDPGSQASDEAARRIFAPGIPFARPAAGSEVSVTPLDRNHLRGFAEAYYRPGRGGLVIAGDVSFKEMEALATLRFGDWAGAPPPSDGFTVEPRTRERRVWVVDRPGSVQSEIRVGHVGVERAHPDVFALTVANTLLGGAFTSRLNLNLRERNGFTYGVRSRFTFRRQPGAFQVGTSVGTEVTAPAVREVVAELARLVDDGPTTEEVEASRDYIAGIFPLRLETVSQVAGRISEQVIYDLDDDYHRTYRDRVRAVTTDDAAAAARRHIRPAEAQIVVVGDAAAVVPPLEALELGPVEVVSSAG
ncbi:MAG TPA: pitrilysin family protein [Longimicrobiales bacterium]|nr:pitrilysin family protein [Longimicrobiales bacterium]